MIRVHFNEPRHLLTELLEVASERPDLIAYGNVRIEVQADGDEAFGTAHIGVVIADQLLTAQSEYRQITDAEAEAAKWRVEIRTVNENLDVLPGRFQLT